MMESEISVVDTICRSLKDVVNTNLVHCLELTQSQMHKVPIKQKTKDLKSGDIVLPWFVKADENMSLKLLQCTQEGLHKTVIPIKNVLQDKHNLLSFHLDRPEVTRDVLKEVSVKGMKYGQSQGGQGHSIMLQPYMDGCDDKTMMKSPMQMRIYYTLHHLKRLLEACGYQVTCSERLQCLEGSSEPQSVRDLTWSSTRKSNTEQFISCAKVLSTKQKENGETDDGEIDLKSIIHQEKFYVGKDGVDKNLNKTNVFSPDNQVTDILKDAAFFDANLSVDSENKIVIHVVPQGRIFHLQQMIVLHAGVSRKKIHQSYLTVGPVICKGNVTVEQFQRSRFEQMKEASEMRHGIKCEGLEWENKIDQMSQSVIKIDVLGTILHCPLKMDLQSSHCNENRLGAFVLYNTARLSTLLKQFSLGVENGTYPPLPDLDDVNFSLLREQEEWELLFLYVASFPNIVKESVEVVLPDKGRLAAKIHTHRITNFLICFSKSLSSYYSRHRILGGPESHLLPLMFARLHLVQACHRVLCNSLHLLDIQPQEEL